MLMQNEISKNFWELPELTQINRLPMVNTAIPYENAQQALSFERSKSPFFMSIDGEWDFILLNSPDEDFSNKSWRKINVPGLWTTQNVGDDPIYTNVKMPFDNNPPFVPKDNPTGIYRTKFTLPATWQERRIVIHIGGAESVFELYLNDKFVGLSKDSRLPAEFDLTPYCQEGENEITCRVIRWSDASYLEDQDHWWNAGIYRSCYIYSTNKEYFLNDVVAIGDYDIETCEGILNCESTIGFFINDPELSKFRGGPENDFIVEYQLRDSQGKIVLTHSEKISYSFRKDNYTNKCTNRIANIRPWSSEKPNLYTMSVTLKTDEGEVVEAKAIKVGFKNVVIKNSELLINGQLVYIKGVNRHEHDEFNCKTLTLESMISDIRLLKQFNFNAVRNCHYPDDHRWYELCDEYGIYLMDEANIEAHANYSIICRDLRWKNAFIDRCERMVLRTRSHVSIFAWSLGNETGFGENHVAAAKAIRALDDSRIIHNEGELKRLWSQGTNTFEGKGFNLSNEVINPMYPPISKIVEVVQANITDRPVICCEYSHAMGNSNGSLGDYWDMFKKYHGAQGGFIWDWVDQGLAKYDDNGVKYWAYGGDFGEKIHDFDFCINGMVWPDRTPHPAMFEFKYLVQPVAVNMLDLDLYSIVNEQNFSNMEHLKCRWALLVAGEIVENGEIEDIHAEAGFDCEVEMKFEIQAIPANQKAHLCFFFHEKEETSWCEADHIVAQEQFEITDLFEVIDDEELEELSKEIVINNNHISCGELSLDVDATSGDVSLSLANEKVIDNLAAFNVFRAGTDNDGIRGWEGQENKPLGLWQKAELNDLKSTLLKLDIIQNNDNSVSINRQYQYSNSAEQTIDFVQEFTLYPCGKIEVYQNYNFDATLPSLPRVGVIHTTAGNGYEEVDYLGLGPFENYIDRNRAAFYGHYQTTVKELYTPYILPQENGNRTNTECLTLSNGTTSIEFNYIESPFEFSASHFTAKDLFSALHTNELKAAEATYVTMDLMQRGLGTGSCGPQTLKQYEVLPKQYEFAFSIKVSNK